MNEMINQIDWQNWQPTVTATLCFVVQKQHILLIKKKRGLGAGLFTAPGGKLDPGETPLEASLRECQEELCIRPHAQQCYGKLDFHFLDGLKLRCYVFRADSYEGISKETDEAIPVWYSLNEIPYHAMWEDDVHWLPYLINRQGFSGQMIFDQSSMQAIHLIKLDQNDIGPLRQAAGMGR